MPPAGDPRRIVGSEITAKALHVTNLGECTRQYGSNNKTKMLLGTVVNVNTTVNPASNRGTTTIVGDYDLGGGTIKRAELNIRSVQVAPVRHVPPPATPVVPPFASPAIPPAANPVIPPADNPVVYPVEIPVVPPAAPVVPPVAPVGSPAANPAVPPDINQVAGPALPPPPRPPLPALPTVTAHHTHWYDDDRAVTVPLNNRTCRPKKWFITDINCDKNGPGTDIQGRLSRLDYFLLMFPPKQIDLMLCLTNRELISFQKKS